MKCDHRIYLARGRSAFLWNLQQPWLWKSVRVLSVSAWTYPTPQFGDLVQRICSECNAVEILT